MKFHPTSHSLLAATFAAAVLVLTACSETDQPDLEQTAADLGSTDVVTAIPDDIPIDLGLVDMSGDGGDYVDPHHGAPVTRLAVCGDRLWPVDGAADELVTTATGPEYGDTRDLITLPTVDAAVSTIEAVRAALGDCATDGDQVWTVHESDTGYDSVTFSLSYTEGLGLSTYHVTRVGNAVLFTVIYGEGAIGDAEATARLRDQLVQDIAPSLCVFSQAGC